MQYLSRWKRFETYCKGVGQCALRELFENDPHRVERLTFRAAGIRVDLSKNHVTHELIDEFQKLCEQAGLAKATAAMYQGDEVNHTERRAVLHTALRQQDDTPVIVDGDDVMPLVRKTREQMTEFVQRIYQGDWRGATGKQITDIVNIGIGGSDLGPRMVVSALRPYWQHKVNVHFVANADAADLNRVLATLQPETTLFIIVSKTFTTQETLLNATSAKQWLLAKCQGEDAVARHFVAVTSASHRAVEFGLAPANCFAMWDFVGGRYSLWSAVGLAIMLAIGPKHFNALLEGAAQMDTHFQTAPVAANLPALLALVGIVYNNVWGLHSHAVIPYAQDLQALPAYLQQADMESNGKSVNHKGVPVQYATGPIIWGGVGTNGQHAFHQLLHQGTVIVPVDFILPLQAADQQDADHHAVMVANCLAQAQALMQGKSYDQAITECHQQGLDEVDAMRLAPHKVVVGNKPSTVIALDKLTPATLGALIALYEHKIFTQSVLWQINAFDQFGVELGKQLGRPILEALKGKQALSKMDASTRAWIEVYRHL